MKSLLFTLIFTLISLVSYTQTTHLLTGYDMYFEPDTLFIEPGDTVEFLSVGYHSATEIDSINWENNDPTSNGGFYVGFGAPTSGLKFAISNTGTYYYICVPHSSMGMKGVIISETTTAINETSKLNHSRITPLSENRLKINNDNCDYLSLIDLNGRVVNEFTLNEETTIISLRNIASGTYVGLFKSKGETVKAVKFISH